MAPWHSCGDRGFLSQSSQSVFFSSHLVSYAAATTATIVIARATIIIIMVEVGVVVLVFLMS